MTELASLADLSENVKIQAEAQVQKPVSVLQLVHSNENGGVEALARMIAAGLEKRGASVDTRFMYPAISATTGQKLRGIASAVTAIARRRPDVLIAYQSTASAIVGVAGALFGCKKRIVHQTAMPDEIHPVVRLLDAAVGSLGFYSINITNSAATDDAFSSYSRHYRKYLRRIDHGLDAPSARLPRTDILSRYAIPDDGLLLLSAGRLCEQKGQDRAIRALPHVSGARLVLAGGGPDESRLKELARSLSITDRVHFVGILSHDEIGDILGAVDMLVFPSVWETFGLAAVEAAMAGVPIVAADLPVLREVLSAEGGSPVVFVDAEKPLALAEAIEVQRQKTRDNAEILGFRDAMRDKYSQDRMLSSHDELVFGADR